MISNYKKLKPIDEIKFVICNLDDFNWARDYILLHNLKYYHQILIPKKSEHMGKWVKVKIIRCEKYFMEGEIIEYSNMYFALIVWILMPILFTYLILNIFN